jgi:hydrogenase maturation protease
MGSPHKILIAGVGNLLLGDDGVGIHAVRELSASPQDGIEVLDLGTAVLHALSFFEPGCRILAIDAMRAGGAPGSLYLINGRDAAQNRDKASLHAMGLCASLRLLPDEGRSIEVIILGIEPTTIAYGMELSDDVREVLPAVIEEAASLARDWRASERPVDRFLRNRCRRLQPGVCL